MKLLVTLLTLTFLIVELSACKKNKPEDNEHAVIVTSFTPMSGPFGTTVTINGSGFSANPAENIVKFNNVAAVVQTATATQLIVVVPKGAGTGTITVQTNNKSVTTNIYNYTSTVRVSTFAGSGLYGFADGNATTAKFKTPLGIAIDSQGNILVADAFNDRIRKITQDGIVSTFAGSGIGGFADGNAQSARFANPRDIAADSQGNIYVYDESNLKIRKVSTTSIVSTFIDQSNLGINSPLISVSVDAHDNIYLGNFSQIFKVTPMGGVNAFAGTLTQGFSNGQANVAQFKYPLKMVADQSGNLYITDFLNHCIRKITQGGITSTFAGTGVAGFADGDANSAKFNNPHGIAIDKKGNLYVSDYGNHRIRKITPGGLVSTLAGNGVAGFSDGDASTAQFNLPTSIALDSKGNIYVSDYINRCIRKITIE